LSPLEATLLGILQGLTEFLPISSSGHLVLGEFLLKVKFDDISFEVFLHLGTSLSVVIVFRHTIWSVLKAVWLKSGSIFGRGSASLMDEEWRLFWLLVAGSIPAGIAGLWFKDYLEKSFSSVVFVSFLLLITGMVLVITQFFRGVRRKLSLSDALVVGLTQALALLPGISRSGLTISAGIFKGVERTKSAEFSFLLSLPAVLGASLLELKEVLNSIHPQHNLWIYLTGTTVAFMTGYLAIRFLLNILRRGKFQYFGYYCMTVGISFLLFAR